MIPILIIQISDPNFKKVDNVYCDKFVNTSNTISEAIKLCADDELCTMFYHDARDRTVTFKTCHSRIALNASVNGTFAYLKRSGTAMIILNTIMIDVPAYIAVRYFYFSKCINCLMFQVPQSHNHPPMTWIQH